MNAPATTMLDVLEANARITKNGFWFIDYEMNATFMPYVDVIGEARRRAVYFRSLGLRSGDRLALMVPDVRDFVLSFYGAIAGSLVPVPMYPLVGPRASADFLRTAASIVELTQTRVLLADILPEELSQAMSLAGVERFLTSAEVAESKVSEPYIRPVDPSPDDPCFLQFTSGSTRTPKGVIVSHANLLANSHAIMAYGVCGDSDKDCSVCWLPLYHDMGLIGHVIAPFTVGMSAIFMPTLAFIARPNTWMETVHKFRATVAFGPNFALALAAKRATNLEALDLSCLKLVGCGAEPIRPETLRTFSETFARAGLRPEAVTPCYGLAESTLAVTFESLDRAPRTIRIERSLFETKGLIRLAADADAQALEVVSCGKPFPEHRIAILNDDGVTLPEGEVGEIGIQGPSVVGGYFRDPEGSRAIRSGDWLLTGDRGFLLDSDLFVCGRKKDLLIVNGRNYEPQALEWTVEELAGVRRGGVVAFTVPGPNTEAVIVVAETREDVDRRPALKRQIHQRLRDGVGVMLSEVLLIDAGLLPKTSSGKLQRQKTKQMYLSGQFAVPAPRHAPQADAQSAGGLTVK